MKGGYQLLDCEQLDLTSAVSVVKTGFWNKAKEALSINKPLFAYNCIYGSGKPVSPVPVFGWYLSATSIVIVGATLHVIVDSSDNVVVQDVAPPAQAKSK